MMNRIKNCFWFIFVLELFLLIPLASSVTLTPELIDRAEVQAFKATVCEVNLPSTACVNEVAEMYYGIAKLYKNFVEAYVVLPSDTASQQTALQNCQSTYGADKCTLVTRPDQERLYIKFSHEPFASEIIGFLVLEEDDQEKVYRSTGGGPGLFSTTPLIYTMYTCSLDSALHSVCTSSQQTGTQPSEAVFGNRDSGNQLYESGTENPNNQFVFDLTFPTATGNRFATLNINVDASYLSFFTLPQAGAYSSLWYGDVGHPEQLGYYGPPTSEGIPPFYPLPNLKTYKLISVDDVETFTWEPEEE